MNTCHLSRRGPSTIPRTESTAAELARRLGAAWCAANRPVPAFNAWQFVSAPSGYLAGFAGNSIWGNGLHVTAVANAPYCCNQYGQWVFTAPGTSFIYRADLTGMGSL